MLFSLEQDLGDRLILYAAPDGFSGSPRLRLSAGGRDLGVCGANELRLSLVSAGRHETGMCGFNIDEGLVPDLARMHDLALFDEDTGLLIYRRPPPDRLQLKMLRLETHLFPLRKCDAAIGAQFQHYVAGLEHWGRETVTQLFLLNGVDSVYLSGRILYKNFATYIESGFEVVTVLHAPHAEFAERLLVLSMLSDMGAQCLGERDAVRFRPAIDYAAALPLDEPKKLRRALTRMPDGVALLLADPLVRQLTTSTPDEMPGGGAIAGALDTLAACAFVGLRDQPAHVTETWGAALGLDPAHIPPPPIFPRVGPLAQFLKDTRVVDHLIERDLEVFGVVEGAYGGTFFS